MSEEVGTVLRTRRLILEPITVEDTDELLEAVVSQESVMKWLATGQVGTRADAESMCHDHVAHWADYGYGDFAVRDVVTREFHGRVGLRYRAEHGVDLGFALHPRYHGRGIAREAGTACLRWAFGRLALPVVFAFVLPHNAESIALLRRLGGTEAGNVLSSGLQCLRFQFTPSARIKTV